MFQGSCSPHPPPPPPSLPLTWPGRSDAPRYYLWEIFRFSALSLAFILGFIVWSESPNWVGPLRPGDEPLHVRAVAIAPFLRKKKWVHSRLCATLCGTFSCLARVAVAPHPCHAMPCNYVLLSNNRSAASRHRYQ